MNTAAKSFSFNSRRALLTYLAGAAGVAALDLLTKQLAVSLVGDNVVPLFGASSLMVVFNTGGAGGVTVGPYTWHLNVLVTMVAIALISSIAASLIRVDRKALAPLCLVAGGAMGNLSSMLWGPAGVADFLAYRLPRGTSIVMNVADLALWSGALLLLPVVMTLVRAIRKGEGGSSARVQLS